MAWIKAVAVEWRKQAEAGYNLKVEPTGFVDQLDMKWEREGTQGRHQVLQQGCWKDCVAINEFEKL